MHATAKTPVRLLCRFALQQTSVKTNLQAVLIRIFTVFLMFR